MKLPRFAYEYRNYRIRVLDVDDEEERKEIIDEINKYILACENGFITIEELMRTI